MDEAMRRLVDGERAARKALDQAMVHPTQADELGRLWRAWITANDALADAIVTGGKDFG